MIRGSHECCNRYLTGSVFVYALISSRKHSCANVFCRRNGDRSGPVKNGDITACVSTRSPRMLPAPPHFPLMHPSGRAADQ